MTRLEILREELRAEAVTTRRHLERLPAERFDWRPHEKSYTARQLAAHLIDCIRWSESIFSEDTYDWDHDPMRPLPFESGAALLDVFDTTVSRAAGAMAGSADEDCTGTWSFVMKGRVVFARPREAAFRDMTLNHLIHHRGQLSVYLRLLDVPVPGSYGPTADER